MHCAVTLNMWPMVAHLLAMNLLQRHRKGLSFKAKIDAMKLHEDEEHAAEAVAAAKVPACPTAFAAFLAIMQAV